MELRPEQQFQQKVRESLDCLTPQLVPVLTALVQHKYPPEVAAIDFEIFSDAFCSQFPVRAFFLDSNNTEFFLFVDGQATYPSPIDPGLLEIDCVYPQLLEDDLSEASPECDPWHLATLELLRGFQSCWDKSGGRGFHLAATIAHHDSSEELNLLTGEVQCRGSSFGA